MKTVTYNLRHEKDNSIAFYADLKNFTNHLLDSPEFDVTFHIQKFFEYQNLIINQSSSYQEYLLDFLTLGVLINEHSGKALHSKKWARSLSKYLFNARKKNLKLKPYIDKIRGWVSTLFLSKEGLKKTIIEPKQLDIFVDWLKATGEYKEESNRLEPWLEFFHTIDPASFTGYISKAYNIAYLFNKEAAEKLGKYTHKVNQFLYEKWPQYRFREDYLFCGKHEVEYHLNMVGAALMNRGLSEDFEQTIKKILLLPTCMANPNNGECKHIVVENKLYCTGCSTNCNINKYRMYGNENDISVNLIPHSTSFSKYLKEWKDQKTVGLIGVSCVLNLMQGGYEMKKLNIPSQCIFLDYCGCKNHWHKEGIPTDIDFNALENINFNVNYKQLITMFS